MAGEGVFVHANAEAGRITDLSNATRNVDVKLAKLSKEGCVIAVFFLFFIKGLVLEDLISSLDTEMKELARRNGW